MNQHIKQAHLNNSSKIESVNKSKGRKTKPGAKRALATELSNDYPASSFQNYFEDSDCDDSFILSMVDFNSNVSVPSQSILSDENFADM